MLTREDTARVLLGELRPWRDWETLLQSAGEFRYCEAGGVPVLHMDHGGSQWYGTQEQR